MAESIVGYALSIGRIPADWVTLQSFRGIEGMSREYRFKLRVETPIPAEDLELVALGSTATLFIRSAGHDRQIHGLVSSVRRDDAHLPAAPSYAVYTIEIVPNTWLLGRRVGSRIFQDVSVVDVINTVLDKHGLPRKWLLERARPARPYITQYEESDWAFIKRLAAENGIFFSFDHARFETDLLVDKMLAGDYEPQPAHILQALAGGAMKDVGRERSAREEIVFTDHASYVPISGGGVLPFLREGAPAAASDFVRTLSVKRAVRSTVAAFTEYDWRRPQQRVGSTAAAERDPTRPGEPDDLELYEHHLRDHEADWEDEAFEAERILAAARRHAVRGAGESSSARLMPGHSFVLDGHPTGDGAYVVTRLRHQGTRRTATDARPAYSNHFEVVPAEVRYLAPRPERKTIQACLTATVAGAPGEEIHTNQHGQIKVKFHWDRRSERADPTCWLRCMHPWAGNGWGFQFIPRVGMEVVVTFEGGDPDRPLVLGTVYNGLLPEPFTLPQHATRSGIRTRSTPRSEGFNELSFEDATDHEQVFLRAQRDFDQLVQRHRTATVQSDDSETVGGGQSISVGGTQILHVHENQEITVDRDVSETTIGSYFETRNSVDSHILEDRIDTIDGMHQSFVGGPNLEHTAGTKVDRVDGNASILVGHGDGGGHFDLDSVGDVQIKSRANIDISAHDEIVLRVGDSFIRIASDAIDVVSPNLTLRGKDARIRLADGACKVLTKSTFQVVSEDQIILRSSGASIGLKSQANIAGSQVLLNSPSQATDDLEAVEVLTTDMTLTGPDGAPLPHSRFRVTFDDGTVFVGVTDGDGNATIEGSGDGEIEFPDHTDPERQ